MRFAHWINAHIPPLSGKTYVITGANSGIGFEAAKIFAQAGAHVIMACRSKPKAQAAIEKIKAEVPTARLSFLAYDQASFASIREFVTQLQTFYPDFDGFVFNAGIYHPQRGRKTSDGYPLTIGTNYFGSYYLLHQLLLQGVLNRPHPIRLLFVGSLIWRAGYLRDPSDVLTNGNLSKQRQYNTSKTAIGTLAYALHQGYHVSPSLPLPKNTTVLLMHPGVTDTNIVNADAKGFPRWFTYLAHRALTLFTHRPHIASLGIPWLLTIAQPNQEMIAVPRGFLHISGYPKLIPYPTAVKKNPERLLRETAYILKNNQHL